MCSINFLFSFVKKKKLWYNFRIDFYARPDEIGQAVTGMI